MRYIFCFFVFFHVIHSQVYSAASLEETFSSSAEQILTLTDSEDFLIHSLIHPLSGYPCLSQTDMVAQGAQPVEMRRIFIPDYTPLNEEKGQINPSERSYDGWVYCPHAHLNVFRKEETLLKTKRVTETLVSVSDPHGVVLTYTVDPRGTCLKTRPNGICNGITDHPNGKHDPRNTKIVVNDTKVMLQAPDGTKRHYVCSKLYRLALNKEVYSCFYCLLEKEILPNGKVLRYEYNQDRQVSKITSLDPTEKLVYASIDIKASPFSGVAACTTLTGKAASYQHRTPRHFREQKKCVDLLYPLQFVAASSPFFRNETAAYIEDSKQSRLEEYSGRGTHFKSHVGKWHSLKRVGELFLKGNAGFQSACTIETRKSQRQGDTTSVSHCDGTKTIYEFTCKSLPQSVSYLNEKGQLIKSKTFDWTSNQWLKSLTVKDGQGSILSEKTFDYDSFGNPISEKFIGNLTGHAPKEIHEIKREFSQDGFQLLLREEDGKTVCFSYIPGTHLLASKLTKDQNRCLLREFRFYDASYNLTRILKDDGSSDSPDDLSDVTYRLITDFQLRQQPPFLHMPDAMEEKYAENGEEKLLKRIEFIYDSHGYVTQEKVYDAEAQFAYVIDKTYDEQGNLLSETNALGQKLAKTFDAHGREKTSTNFAGTLVKAKEYDRRGNLSFLQETGEGISRTHAYSYDLKDRLIKKIDSYQHATSYSYDLIANQPIQVEGPPLFTGTGSVSPVIQKTAYDPLGREIFSVDPNGNCTITKYNSYGSPTAIIHPDNTREMLRYTKKGLLEVHILPNGLALYYLYDVLGHVVEKHFFLHKEPLAKESFSYKGDLLIRYTDLEGHTTYYSYDGAGRKIREERCGHVSTYHYDRLGEIDLICDENEDNSLCTHFRRNLLGQVLEKQQTDAQGNLLTRITYAYDANGNVKTIERQINGQHAIESFAYDADDREILYQNGEGWTTHTSYDEHAYNHFGQQVLKKTTIDPQNRTIEETFDPYGRLAKRETFNPTHETIAAEEHEYDPCGNVLSHTDSTYQGTDFLSKKVLAFTYDSCHRVLTSTRAFGTPDARTTQLSYSPGGNLALKILPDGMTLSYAYDPFDRLKTIRSSDNRLSHSFHYNRLGHLLKATDELSGLTITRKVDPHGNILKEEVDGNTIEKTYDLFNRPLSLSLPDHTKILYIYDPLFLRKVERLSPHHNYQHLYDAYDTSGFLIKEQLIANLGAVTHEADLIGHSTARKSPYFSQTCEYDSIGHVIRQSIDDNEETFVYDPLAQLIEEPSHTYFYDSTYNRLQKDGESCQANDLDELSMDSIECKYDLRGNLIEKKTLNNTYCFSYTPQDQLSEATFGNTKICFSYDPIGRRIGRQQYRLFDNEWQQISNDALFYDGNHELGQIKQGSIQQLRIPGHNKHPIAIELEGQTYAPLIDIQGNIRRLIHSDTQTLAAHYAYSAFGEQSVDDQPLLNPWQYAAKRFDFDLGLIDFGKRHYDPQLGRWITPDPIGIANNRNLYQYNFNDPFRYYDPNGTLAILFIPVIKVTFDFVITWVSAEALLGTAVGATLAYGVYHVANGIEGAMADDPAVHQEAVVEEEEKTKGKGQRQEVTDTYAPDRPLPLDGKGRHIPESDYPHTQLGTREGDKGKYPQAREFDEYGRPVRDIDFTDHGHPSKHRSPHQHRWKPNPTGGSPIRIKKPEDVNGYNYENKRYKN